MTIRLLVVARRPIRADDFGLDQADDIEIVHLARRLGSLPELVASSDADVVLVDVSFADGASFGAIAAVGELLPDVRVLALTGSPPDHSDVARAFGAGAVGFIDTDAEPHEFSAAVRAVHAGEGWLPEDDIRSVLRDVAEDLDVTVSERRSRLITVAIGLVPAAGAIAAVLAILWRKYFGQIGVRPVDLAVDPTTRVIDAVAAASFLLGVFGPLLYVKGWLDDLDPLVRDRAGWSWLAERRKLAAGAISVVLLVAAGLLTVFNDLVLILFVGPVVATSILAEVLDLTEELPRPMRLRLVSRSRAAIVGMATLFFFLTVLSTEVLLLGPRFDTRGAEGFLAPRILGFRAQPALVFDVDGAREPREVLYLGGNADLYIFVDPCDDDAVEMVSVGSSRIEIIDQVTCR